MVAPDLSALTFQEWMQFIFDHPVRERPWSWDDVNYDISNEETILSYFTQLFKNPVVLLQFSEEQIDQGFWFILGFEGFMGVLWNPSTQFSKRKECIDSMYDLYQLLFGDHRLLTISFMWWDFLTEMYDLYEGQPQDDDDAQVQEAMFQVLIKLLDTTNPVQAKSALHGLGHIKHPKSRKAIDQFLLSHSEIGDDLKDYANGMQSRLERPPITIT